MPGSAGNRWSMTCSRGAYRLTSNNVYEELGDIEKEEKDRYSMKRELNRPVIYCAHCPTVILLPSLSLCPHVLDNFILFDFLSVHQHKHTDKRTHQRSSQDIDSNAIDGDWQILLWRFF